MVSSKLFRPNQFDSQSFHCVPNPPVCPGPVPPSALEEPLTEYDQLSRSPKMFTRTAGPFVSAIQKSESGFNFKDPM